MLLNVCSYFQANEKIEKWNEYCDKMAPKPQSNVGGNNEKSSTTAAKGPSTLLFRGQLKSRALQQAELPHGKFSSKKEDTSIMIESKSANNQKRKEGEDNFAWVD